MKTLYMVGALALALFTGGCNTLAGIAKVNEALVPDPKPLDMRVHSDLNCGDVANAVLGVLGGGQVPVTGAQAVAIVQACERRDASMTLTIDPKAARKALGEMATKPPLPLAGATGP